MSQRRDRSKYLREWHKKNPDYYRDWYARNREKQKAKGQEYYKKNRKRILAYRRLHPEPRLRHLQKNRDWLASLKNKPCVDCGKRYPPYVMDFDHVRGKKLFNIGRDLKNRARKILLAEIAKCDLVCANCHRERTSQRRQYG